MVLETGGQQVLLPPLPRSGPLLVSQAEFEQAMRLEPTSKLVALAPNAE
ncbi:hypothetical protein [Archangium violaceum]|nr:hypothetical protein [Archangium violaceum]